MVNKKHGGENARDAEPSHVPLSQGMNGTGQKNRLVALSPCPVLFHRRVVALLVAAIADMKRTSFICMAILIVVFSVCGCSLRTTYEAVSTSSPVEADNPKETLSQDGPSEYSLNVSDNQVQQVMPTPTPTFDPIPDPSLIPTPELTPMPSPEVTPSPTQKPIPVITKQPASENISLYSSVSFVARADFAEKTAWFLASPDGNIGINANELATFFPGVSCSGTSGETLVIEGTSLSLNGWKAICKFSNDSGSAFSEAASITISNAQELIDGTCQMLDLILRMKPEATAGVSLSNAYITALFGDYFVDCDLSSDDIRYVVSLYVNGLTDQDLQKYKENADRLFGLYSNLISSSDHSTFDGNLSDSGYNSKYYPFEGYNLLPYFEVLKIQ